MNRITVSLPEDLVELLAREAHRMKTSVSEMVRRAVSTQLGLSGTTRKKIAFAKLGRSGHAHTARDAEKVLATEWNHARDR